MGKKNQVSSVGPTASAAPAKYAPIDAAAQKLSDASYPFLKEVNYMGDIYTKPFPGTSLKDNLKAVDKAIVMGTNMDGNLLKAAAEAHHKAIGSIDANGVTSAADYAALNAALAKAIASVPSNQVMDVYNAFAKAVPGAVPNMMFSMVNSLDANAAAKAFYDFKDVVKAVQR